jgi:transposase-like protein
MNDRELLDHAEQEIVRVERREGERRKGERRECFKCPICDDVSTSHVLEGRMNHAQGYYWRRHRCDACGETYTSKQTVEAIGRPTTADRVA